jgi:hypothetical protein
MPISVQWAAQWLSRLGGVIIEVGRVFAISLGILSKQTPLWASKNTSHLYLCLVLHPNWDWEQSSTFALSVVSSGTSWFFWAAVFLLLFVINCHLDGLEQLGVTEEDWWLSFVSDRCSLWEVLIPPHGVPRDTLVECSWLVEVHHLIHYWGTQVVSLDYHAS